jgi:hypothetical protein
VGFFKIKRKGKKEFMKYEDGKIIPVEVEEHKNYKEFNINSASREEEVDIKTIIKEKVDMPGKVKRYGTFKTLKIAGAIAIIVFFGFTVKDVYVAFTTDDTPNVVDKTQNETPKETPTNIDNGGNDVPKQTPTETGSFQPGSEDIPELPPVVSDDEKGDNDQTPSNEGEKSPLKTAIDASNVVNNMLISETSKEVGNLNQYFDNKLNKFSFEKKLKASLETKKQLALFLTERKHIFKDEGILDFYGATEERVTNSIQLTQSILDSFNTDVTNDTLTQMVNDFIKTENTLKEKQNGEFIEVLKDKKIDYTFDESKGEIKYTIK